MTRLNREQVKEIRETCHSDRFETAGKKVRAEIVRNFSRRFGVSKDAIRLVINRHTHWNPRKKRIHGFLPIRMSRLDTEAKNEIIRRALAKEPQKIIAYEFGVSVSVVSKLKNGRLI